MPRLTKLTWWIGIVASSFSLLVVVGILFEGFTKNSAPDGSSALWALFISPVFLLPTLMATLTFVILKKEVVENARKNPDLSL
jgi:ABC-type sugar transport system permease subunit